MEPSILYTIKRMLGVAEENRAFDLQIQVSINAVLMTINQLGIGPEDGFRITGVDETWDDLIGDRKDLDQVQSYIYLKTRLMFDPPTNSFLVKAIEDQCAEMEWRLKEQVNERRRQLGDKDHSFGGYDPDTSWSQGSEMGSNENAPTARTSSEKKTNVKAKTEYGQKEGSKGRQRKTRSKA